jgi:hypothetical protein
LFCLNRAKKEVDQSKSKPKIEKSKTIYIIPCLSPVFGLADRRNSHHERAEQRQRRQRAETKEGKKEGQKQTNRQGKPGISPLCWMQAKCKLCNGNFDY